MRPFLLDQASQFRAEPPPALTQPPVRQGPERDRGLGRVEQHRTHSGADGDRVLLGRQQHQPVQPDDAERRCAARHGPRRRRASARDGRDRERRTPGSRCFDSKFFYHAWRPITAIRNADKDGNPDTTADPTWQALLQVPGHPEYPSQHGCFTAAFSDALAVALHTKHLDVTMPRWAERQRRPHDDAALRHRARHPDRRSIDARVWLGFHFRNSVEQGVELGNDVAKWELERFFQPADS